MMDNNHAPTVGGPEGKGISRYTSAFNGRLLFSCSLIALSQINFGMDQGAFTNTQVREKQATGCVPY